MSFSITTEGNAFAVLSRAADQGRRRIMVAVTKSASKVQAGAKINVHQKLNTTGKSKGTLSRSITVLRKDSRLEAEIGPSVIYGRIHEFGGVIKPVKGLYLWFRLPGAQAISYSKDGTAKAGKMTDGHLIRVKQVTIPARPYLTPALNDARPEINTIFEQEIRGLLSDTPRLLGG